MAAPSRAASLGAVHANVDDSNGDDCGLMQYEVLRNKQKEELHVQIQLALLKEGVVLDERVLQGFDGEPPP
jgi:hypothetical protein